MTKVRVRVFLTEKTIDVELDHVADCPCCEAARSVKFESPGDVVFLEALDHPRGLCRLECAFPSPLAVMCVQVTPDEARAEIAGHSHG